MRRVAFGIGNFSSGFLVGMFFRRGRRRIDPLLFDDGFMVFAVIGTRRGGQR